MRDEAASFRIRLHAKFAFVRLLSRLKFSFSYVFSLMDYDLGLSRVSHVAIFTLEWFFASMESFVGLQMTDCFESC